MDKDATVVQISEEVSEESEIGLDAIPPSLLLEEELKIEVLQAIPTVDLEVAVDYLTEFLHSHHLDQHLSSELMDDVAQLISVYKQQINDESKKVQSISSHLKAYYYVFHDISPYAEVRSSVPHTDDPTLLAETFRTWFLGLLFVSLFSGTNQFFSFRWPLIYVQAVCIQVLAYPCGKAMERWLPTRKIRIFGRNFTLNPGRFNQKEHMLITIMANIGIYSPYSSFIFEVQILKMFFDQPWVRNRLYQYCITISMQCLGFGIAGMSRSSIVFPDFCIWPDNLATIVLNRSLHQESSQSVFQIRGLRFPQFRYLWVLATLYFIWHILGPGYLFGGSLENFNWITWIKPDSKVLALVTGGVNGLGLNPLPTLDFSHMLFDPFVIPWFSALSLAVGQLLIGLLFNLPLYLTNTWYSGHLPFNTNKLYDRFGKRFVTKSVVDERGNLDLAKYRSYSPLYATAGYSVKFAFYFANYTASISHVILFNHRQVWSGIKSAFSRKTRLQQQNDIHNRLMAAYPETPQWWFLLIFTISFAMAAGALAKWLPEAPIWLLVFAAGIGILFIVPLGIVGAVTGGFVVPGKATAMNMFKAYGCITLANALGFAKDLKLGHYAKISPRSMFRAQVISCLLSMVVCLTVMNWQLDNIEDVCSETQKQKFVCMGTYTFFTSSIIWGTLGPARMYGPGKGIYSVTLYGFLVGALLPVPLYVLVRLGYSRFRHIYTPSLIYGGICWAPYNFSWVLNGLYLGYFFQVYIKRRFFDWWAKYNYLTSCALTLGLAVGGLVAFFAFQYHGLEVDWIGNRVNCLIAGLSGSGVDAKGFSWFDIPEGGFGPGPGEFE